MQHQYIDRKTGEVRTEQLYHDKTVRLLYSRIRENAPRLFNAVVSSRMSKWLGYLNYQMQVGSRLTGSQRFAERLGVDLSECAEPIESLTTAEKFFERKIRYWECRPLPDDSSAVVSPADARVLIGSFRETEQLFLKDKFFRLAELLGGPARPWASEFSEGDFAIFRLTPDKYHYNHVPVNGVVKDIYEVDGCYHACNPTAVVSLVTPYSKNKRVVTIFDTDVPGGSQVGLVAMIEVVALMIGRIEQCYSEERYESPTPVQAGLFLKRGQPKSLYRPGSSTDVLIFQNDRISFAEDLVANLSAPVESRFSQGFGRPLVETDLDVRSLIAVPKASACDSHSTNLEIPSLLTKVN